MKRTDQQQTQMARGALICVYSIAAVVTPDAAQGAFVLAALIGAVMFFKALLAAPPPPGPTPKSKDRT